MPMASSYVGDRLVSDADSHLMESPSWLYEYADSSTRALLPEMNLEVGGAGAEQQIADAVSRERSVSVTELSGSSLVSGPKGWGALGAMSGEDRSVALDVLGFRQQLVFSTFASTQYLFSKDLDLVYGGSAAHNRGIAEFCAHDDRLLPVASLPLNDLDQAERTLDTALELGCAAMWIPYRPVAGHSPAHIDVDRIWARIADAGVPFVLHIGGGRSTLNRAFHDNGRPRPVDAHGGGENLRAKDYASTHHGVETFLSCLLLDGVFERHPGLRCGVIELGASWVPGFLRIVDSAVRSFGRNEPMLQELSMLPSEYARRQIRFTPFHFEDVGWLIDQGGPELFLFSSDYPHPEGGRDPLGKFEASLDHHGIGDDARQRFYSRNFEDLITVSRKEKVA